MRATEALGVLRAMQRPLIETREAAARLGISQSRASHLLGSLEQAGLARRLRRGLWTLRSDLDPFVAPPYLTAPLPAYVSFWSALSHHGMIEQIPRMTHVASPARTQRIVTPLGTYSVHHLAPEVFTGFSGSDETGYLAVPEKALFDVVYLRAVAGGPVTLPELELPPGFRDERLDEWTARVRRPRLRTIASRRLDAAMAQARRSE